MSLLSRRKPVPGPGGKKKDSEDSVSKRNVMKPRRFQISRTTLDCPVLGSEKSTVNLFAPSSSSFGDNSSSTSSFADTKSSFMTFSSSNMNIYSSDRSKIAQDALASSKLSTITASGPLEAMPKLTSRQIKRNRKHEKSLTKGSAWFNMAKAEITKEKKNDLEALKLRSAMDGGFHYKRNNITHTPKYFHVGTVVETSADFYSSRIPKKQRKKTLAQEFAADYGME